MNKHTIHTVNAALRDLDTAPETVLTDMERQHAADTFARIVATSGDDLPQAEPELPRRRRTRLLVPVGVLGAAGVTMAALLLGGTSALASWTPTPQALTSAETAAAAGTCRANFGIAASGEAALLAERRGKWTYVLLSGPQGEASCIMRNDVVGQDPGHGEVLGNYHAEPEAVPTVEPDRIVEMASQSSSIDEGWLRKESWLTWVDGYAGDDITGVTVHTPLGFDVEASVDHGRFAAWWPSAMPSSKNLDVMGAWSYTVTLADGSTRHTNG